MTTSHSVADPARKGIRVDVRRFSITIIPLLASVILFGIALHSLFDWGWHYVVITPCILSIGLAATISWAIRFSKCRSIWFGRLLGGLTAILAYGMSFHAGLVAIGGAAFLFRFDLLPEYVQWRLENTIEKDVGHSSRKADGPSVGKNGFSAVFEIGAMVFICGAAAGVARRAFCESCGVWMRRNVVTLPPGSGMDVCKALRNADVVALSHLLGSRQESGAQRYTVVAAESCPACGQGPLITVKEVTRGGGFSQASQIDMAFGKTLLAQQAVSAPVLSALAPFFPDHFRPASSAEVQSPSVGSSQPTELRGLALAQITSVNGRYAGNALAGGKLILANIVSIGIAVWMPGGFIGGLFLLAHVVEGNAVSPLVRQIGIVAGVVAIVTSVVAMVLSIRNLSWSMNWYVRKLLRDEVCQRPDKIVRPEAPDATFVEVVNPGNINKIRLDDADDVGFIVVDEARREIRFEGDRERWRIPFAAIHAAKPFIKTSDLSIGLKSIRSFITLTIAIPGGTRDLTIGFRAVSAVRNANKDRRQFVDRCTEAIARLQSSAIPAAPGSGGRLFAQRLS